LSQLPPAPCIQNQTPRRGLAQLKDKKWSSQQEGIRHAWEEEGASSQEAKWRRHSQEEEQGTTQKKNKAQHRERMTQPGETQSDHAGKERTMKRKSDDAWERRLSQSGGRRAAHPSTAMKKRGGKAMKKGDVARKRRLNPLGRRRKVPIIR